MNSHELERKQVKANGNSVSAQESGAENRSNLPGGGLWTAVPAKDRSLLSRSKDSKGTETERVSVEKLEIRLWGESILPVVSML